MPRLVAHFLAGIRDRGSARVEGLSAKALDLLLQYPFPGNVRELENLLEGISLVLPPAQTVIGDADLRGWLQRRGLTRAATRPEADPGLKLADLEARAIEEALRRSHGNKSDAARLLGISRDTLYRKLQGSSRRGRLSGSRTRTGTPD